MQSLDFYFDFISPYAYLASTRVEGIAERHGFAVAWKPFRLGVAVVKVMGLPPVMQTPLKSTYIRRDVRRLAQVLGQPFSGVTHETQPLPPARALCAVEGAQRARLAKALLHAQWAQGRNIAETAVLLEVAAQEGIDPAGVARALDDPATREQVNATTREAIARGVFGSPTVAVGDEIFWGVDRLWMLDHYLAHGCSFAPMAGIDSAIREIAARL